MAGDIIRMGAMEEEEEATVEVVEDVKDIEEERERRGEGKKWTGKERGWPRTKMKGRGELANVALFSYLECNNADDLVDFDYTVYVLKVHV